MAEAGASVVGVNCEQEPDRLVTIIREMRKPVTVSIAAQPAAFRTADATPCFRRLPEFPDEMESIQLPRGNFERFAEVARDEGIQYSGGCCGTNARLYSSLRAFPGDGAEPGRLIEGKGK